MQSPGSSGENGSENDEEHCILLLIDAFKTLNLTKYFSIDITCLRVFLNKVKVNYKHLPYHNFRHAVNFTETLVLLAKEFFQRLESSRNDQVQCLGLILAGITHDIGHMGCTNAFLRENDFPILSDHRECQSPMEEYHISITFALLEGNYDSLFNVHSEVEVEQLKRVIRRSILATDLKRHLSVRPSLQAIIISRTFNSTSNSLLKRDLIMTLSDLSDQTRSFQIAHSAAEAVFREQQILRSYRPGINFDEIWRTSQGDKRLYRSQKKAFYNEQIAFLQSIALPVYLMGRELFPVAAQTLLLNFRKNLAEWERCSLCLKHERGSPSTYSE